MPILGESNSRPRARSKGWAGYRLAPADGISPLTAGYSAMNYRSAMGGSEATTVFIVVPPGSCRERLESLFASVYLQVKAVASTEELLAINPSKKHGCIVAHTGIIANDTVAFQRRIREAGWHLPVIYLAQRASVPVAVTALKAGASDFQEMPFNDQTLLDAVSHAAVADSWAAERRARREAMARRFQTLTSREREVLLPMVRCWPNGTIARRLGVSEKTVEAYRGRILHKTGAQNLAELIRMTIRAGLDDAGPDRTSRQEQS